MSASGDALQTLATVSRSLSTLISSSYGPYGKEKLFAPADASSIASSVVTKTGADILEKSVVQHPAGALIVRASRSQNASSCDGSIFVPVFIGALMQGGANLVAQGLHPSGMEQMVHVMVNLDWKLCSPVHSLCVVVQSHFLSTGRLVSQFLKTMRVRRYG